MVEAREAAATEKAAEVSAEKAASKLSDVAAEKVPNSLSKSSSLTTTTATIAPVKKEPKKPADYDDYWYKNSLQFQPILYQLFILRNQISFNRRCQVVNYFP